MAGRVDLGPVVGPRGQEGPAGKDGITSFNGRTGAITPQSGDYSAALVGYAGTGSGLSAATVQAAIDEMANKTANLKTIPDETVTITVTGVDLNNYIAKLPKLLTKNLTIEVNDGTLTYVYITNFYGPGSLTLTAKNSQKTIVECINIRNNQIPIKINGFEFRPAAGYGSSLSVDTSYATFSNCVFVGDKDTFTTQAGVACRYNGFAYFDSCSISNFHYGITMHSSHIALSNCTGSDNTIGINCGSSIVQLFGTTPVLMGGTTNSIGGTLIVLNNGQVYNP